MVEKLQNKVDFQAERKKACYHSTIIPRSKSSRTYQISQVLKIPVVLKEVACSLLTNPFVVYYYLQIKQSRTFDKFCL